MREIDSSWDDYGIVLIPRQVRDDIERERLERRLAEIEADVAEEAKTSSVPSSGAKTDAGSAEGWCDPLSDYPGPTLKLFDRAEIDNVMGHAGMQERDYGSKARNKEMYKFLKRTGEYRKLAQIPQGWPERLKEIEEAFPNFSIVIDYLRAMFVLASRGDRAPRLDPITILGPPGIGKTLFAETLASFFGTTFRRISMENEQANSTLAGTAEHWSNTRPGVVFDLLTGGEVGNPVFLVDEIDKSRRDDRYDPLSPLYVLLEPHTAAAFRDLSFPRIQIDASRIVWLMTANEMAPIPGPILDRTRVFHVTEFNDAEARRVAQQVSDSLQTEYRLDPRFDPLSEEALAFLSGMSARRQRQALREAFGLALMAGRATLLIEDFRTTMPSDGMRRRIGF